MDIFKIKNEGVDQHLKEDRKFKGEVTLHKALKRDLYTQGQLKVRKITGYGWQDKLRETSLEQFP